MNLDAALLLADRLGALVLATVTAVGGGTLRDLILDAPVFWLTDTLALGLAIFAVAGAAKAADMGHGVAVTLIIGVTTAAAGGLLRDVIANRDPLLLQEDVYATAALAGACAYAALHFAGAGEPAAFAAGLVAAFGLRAAAIVFGWSLPKARP